MRRRVPRWCLGMAGVLAITVLFAGGCSRGHQAGAGAPGAKSEVPNPAIKPEPSLFEMTFAMTDQSGHSRRLAEFRGSPFVASMVYTSCKSVCPRVIEELKSLEAALSPSDRNRFRFLLFSLDPERDTPAAMNAFLAGHGLDPSRWTLMAAGPEDMRTIAAVLGVRFRPDGSGEIAHTAMIFAVDRNGVVRYRQTGVGNGLGPLLGAVRAIP